MYPLGDKEISKILDMKYIESIYISVTKRILNNTFLIYGTVTFRKDNSSFSQEFNGESIADVYNQIYEFCNTLNG